MSIAKVLQGLAIALMSFGGVLMAVSLSRELWFAAAIQFALVVANFGLFILVGVMRRGGISD